MKSVFSWEQELETKLGEIEAQRSLLQAKYAELLAQLEELEQRKRQAYRECNEQRIAACNRIAMYLEKHRWADRRHKQQERLAA